MRRESPQPSSDRSSASAPAANNPENHNSDGESEEKPVREKLRDTTIAGQSTGEQATSEVQMIESEQPSDTAKLSADRGRPRRKRSREDLQDEDGDEEIVDTARHVRKRSREAIPGSDVPIPSHAAEESMGDSPSATLNVLSNGTEQRSATPESSSDRMEDGEREAELTSPKNKRTRDQVLRDEEASTSSGKALPSGSASVTKSEKNAGADKLGLNEERKVKRSRDSSSPHASAANGEDTVPQPAKVPFGL
jgi:Ran-binding protein 3